MRAAATLAEDLGSSTFLITNPVDVAYLTGFHGGDSYLLLAGSAGGGGKPLIISDFRYQEELAPLEGTCEIRIRKRSMTEAISDVLKERGTRGLAVQAEHLTLALAGSLGKVAAGVKLQHTSGLVSQLRAIKDASEVALIRKAIAIQEEALEETLPRIGRALAKDGNITEMKIAAMLEEAMKSRGSSKPGFETIIGAKTNGSLPHYRPQNTKLTRNSALLIDWGAIYHGYHGDMTRVVCFGKWPRKIAEIYEIVLEAHERAAAALAPGKSTAEIDAIARDHIKSAGYGDYFGHGLGHGMGLDGHEEPRLTNMLSGTALAPGHVVTIEPGIYLPGIGGVRIEDDFLITAKGAENLCRLPKSLKWATR